MDRLAVSDIPAFLAQELSRPRAGSVDTTPAPDVQADNGSAALAVCAAHSLLTLAKHSYATGSNDHATSLMLTDAIGLLWAIAGRLARQPHDAIANDALQALSREQLQRLDVLKRSLRAAGLFASGDANA
jgi:hypothetical protein